MVRINENTWLPLGKVLSVGTVVVAAVFWIASVANSVENLKRSYDSLTLSQSKYLDTVVEISRDLATIKVQLEDLKEEKQRRK